MAKKPTQTQQDAADEMKATLDYMQGQHARRGQPLFGPTKLPTGEMYTPQDDTIPEPAAPVMPPKTRAAGNTDSYRKGGRVKQKPRGVGCALRGHGKAGKK